MKKLISKPGFEVIFSLSLFAILCLPPLVMAQTQKDFEIKIVNGDTTINGKNIKTLSAQERKEAMTELNNMGGTFEMKIDGKGDNDIIIRKNRKRGGKMDVLVERRRDVMRNGAPAMPPPPHMNGNEDPASSPYKTDFYSNNDALEPAPPRIRLRKLTRIQGDSSMARRLSPGRFELRDDQPMELRVERFRDERRNNRPMRMRFDNRNVQNFDFENTDRDGVSTHIGFRVTDAMPEARGSIAGPDKNYLNLNDLSLSPEFSTGKTLLSFNLPAKTTAVVTLTDNQGQTLLSIKAVGGSFSKKVTMPLNGAYMLTVKQGAASVTKRIIKEN